MSDSFGKLRKYRLKLAEAGQQMTHTLSDLKTDKTSERHRMAAQQELLALVRSRLELRSDYVKAMNRSKTDPAWPYYQAASQMFFYITNGHGRPSDWWDFAEDEEKLRELKSLGKMFFTDKRLEAISGSDSGKMSFQDMKRRRSLALK